MAKKFPVNPKHPERNCWGCDKYCSAKSMMCGNGSERTQHPVELKMLPRALREELPETLGHIFQNECRCGRGHGWLGLRAG